MVRVSFCSALHGKDISTIPDILKEARTSGITDRAGADLELPKYSILRMHNGKLDLHYNIGSGDTDLSLGSIEGYSTGSTKTQDNGISAALSATKFGSRKILIGSSKNMSTQQSQQYTNWFYDLYFAAVSKDLDETITQERFGAWRYPNESGGTKSGYIKDIKTGIFVEHFNGELVVAATMEAANDNPNIAAKFSSKKVNIRLDFWALFTDVDDNIQYKKLDNITITRDGYAVAPLCYAVAPLYGMPAVAYNDNPFKKAGQDTVTTLSPYVLLKTATGDINHDGYENEIAVLVCDTEGIKLCVYQISYSASSQQFSIKQMADAGTIYKYNLTNYYKLLGYNGFSRAPGADILTGDFNGDGQTEIAAVYQGDLDGVVKVHTE